MPNPLNPPSDSESDESNKKGFKQKGRQTFSETLAVLQAGLLNLAEVARQLQARHEREVETLKRQSVQMRKELKLAGAFTKTMSSSSTTSTMLRTLTQASVDDLSQLARRNLLARLSGSPEPADPAPDSDRLEEAKRRRSDRGKGVLQGQPFHGASSNKKRAVRHSRTTSSSTLDSSGSPSEGDSFSAARMSSSSPPSFLHFQTTQGPTPTEWKPTAPTAEPPSHIFPIGMQLTLPPPFSTEEPPSKDLSLADTASLNDTELEAEPSSGDDASASKFSSAKSMDTTDFATFKLHETWSMMTRESTMGKQSTIQMSDRSSIRTSIHKSANSMLKRSYAFDDLSVVPMASSRSRLCLTLTLHPESTIRLCWDLTGMLYLTYDFITVPLQTFGELFTNSETASAVAISGTSFWSLDIIVSLRTGFLQKEVVVMSPWLIFMNYAKSWMLLDICLIALDWGVISSGSSKSAAGSARMLKFLRVFRLLRLRKVMDFISKVEASINSNLAVLMLSLFKYVIVLVMLNHLIACLWYFVGESSSGWTDENGGVLQEAMSYRYLTSLHWSITQFHGTMEVSPTNDPERFMSVIVLVLSMIGNAAFISAVTNKMIQAQTLVQERTRIEQSFRSYLREHRVSLGLSLRLKKTISQLQMDKQSREAKEQLFALIPPNLLMQLHMEVRGSSILGHRFLQKMASAHHRPMMTIISNAVQDLQFSMNSDVFHTGEVGKSMYFTTSGDLAYKFSPNNALQPDRSRGGSPAGSRHDRALDGPEDDVDASEQFLVKGDRISEAPLWVKWVYLGTLKSLTETTMLVLDAEGFMNMVQTSKLFHNDATVYANSFLTNLEFVVNDGQVITDCITIPDEWLRRSSSDNTSLDSDC